MTPPPTTATVRAVSLIIAPCAGMTRIRFDGRGRDAPSQPYLGLPCGPVLALPRYVARLDASRSGPGWPTRRLYLCTDARTEQGDLADFADAALAGGVDIIQLRDKGLEARHELAALEVLADACRRHGALLAVNDRADVALAVGAQVLHLGQDDLPVQLARRIVGDEAVIGRSTQRSREAADVGEPAGGGLLLHRPDAGPPLPNRAARPPGRDLSAGPRRRPRQAMVRHRRHRERTAAGAGAGRRRGPVVVVRAITEATDRRRPPPPSRSGCGHRASVSSADERP